MKKTILLFFSLFLLANLVYGKDTIRLEKKPKVILKSWYPEYKDSPKLKIGESKILLLRIREFDKTTFRSNDINLESKNQHVEIEETEKENQYRVIVNSTESKFVEFEVWLDLENDTIFINQNGKWKNATELYKLKRNRILIDTIKLELEK